MNCDNLKYQQMIDLLTKEKDTVKKREIHSKCLNELNNRYIESKKTCYIGFNKESMKLWQEYANFELMIFDIVDQEITEGKL